MTTRGDPVLGRSDRASWTGASVKGNLVQARPRYVREKWGTDGVQDVLGRLGGEARALFDGKVLPFAWYPFSLLAEIDRAIILGPMGGDPARMKAFGATVARYDLPTVYKVLFKLGTPSFIVKRVGVIYRTYVKSASEMVCLSARATEARVVLRGGSLPLYFCTHGVSGWFTAALELSGGSAVDVSEVECVHRGAPECAWAASWR